MTLEGKILHGTYRLERKLGEGGMGQVYEASHLRLARRFAVKVLIAEAARDKTSLGRFQREAQITSGLGHPHIVEVIDFNILPEGRPYLVMELLAGEDLAARLRRRGGLELPEIAAIARQTTSALHAAHQQGVVHRDLKPENIFLCRRGARDDYVKVLDFGISKVVGAKTMETRQRALLGSPCYMSPEQADEQTAIDARTDVYAMGTLLFEMLAGVPPFSAASLPSLLFKIVHQPHPAIRTLRPDVPEVLEVVLQVALAKEVDRRYQTMEAFWQAFSTALEQIGVDYVEYTAISTTAWPDTPELAVESKETPLPPSPAAPVGPPALGRSTTLSTSVGELTQGAPHRRAARRMALVAGICLLGASVVIFAALALIGDGEQKRPTVAAASHPTDLTVREPPVDRMAPGPVSDAPPATVAPDTAGPRPPAPRVRPPARPRPATLRVGAVLRGKPMPADLYLDGRKVGQAPAMLRGLTPGKHVLELRIATRRKKIVVYLRPGRTRTVSVRLDR